MQDVDKKQVMNEPRNHTKRHETAGAFVLLRVISWFRSLSLLTAI